MIYLGNVKQELRNRAWNAYQRYKSDKEKLKNEIMDSYRWYNRQHTTKVDKNNNFNAKTPYIFNAIENKYADALDNYPEISVIEREGKDSAAAEKLSKILPVQIELAEFKKAYKENWRRKLKSGTAIYFVNYDDDEDQIKIKAVNILSFFADYHVKDIQESQFIFVTNAVDNEELKARYPEYSELFDGDCSMETSEGTQSMQGRTEVVDCYYKKTVRADGKIKRQVHMMKLVNGNIIEATEDMDGYEDGMYRSGKYPFVMDVLYPIEDCPYGFGIIDIVKSTQEVIDKIDSAITKNTLICAHPKTLVKDSSGIDINALADCDADIVTVPSGDLTNVIKEFNIQQLSAHVGNYRDRKIEELKEIIGNRDFQQGGNSGGVTSGTAIELLQRSGEKMSRANVDDSYDAYRDVCIMVIDLMRQFFTEPRTYRVTGAHGEKEDISFGASDIQEAREIPMTDEDGNFITDINGNIKANTEYKPILLEVSVTAQKSNPYTKQGQNATMSELYKMGVFSPDNLEYSIILLESMQIEGKEKILDALREKLSQQQMQIQMQQMMQQQMMQQQSNDELIAVPTEAAEEMVAVPTQGQSM